MYMASVPDRDLPFNVEEQRVRIAKMLSEIEKAGLEQQKVLADRLRVEQETRFAPFTLLATGAGAAALGDPAAAVAWAANTLGELGVTLEAGHVIMTGALHASVPVAAGDTVRATIDRLGSVGVRFA